MSHEAPPPIANGEETQARCLCYPRSATVRHGTALVLFLVLACVQTWPLAVRLDDGLIGLATSRTPNTDVSIFLWNFWWVKKALLELHQNPAYCDWVGSPGPPVFVFPTLSLLNSLFALPLTGAFSLETTYNILILAILALTGWSAYLLVSDMTGAWLPSLLAGLIYGTLPLQINQVSQLNIFTLFWMPLALLAARRFLATGRWSAAVALGAFFLCNLLSSWYHAIALALLLAILSVVKLWQIRSERVRILERRWWPLLAVWVLFYVIGGQINLSVHVAFWLSVPVCFVVFLHWSQDNREFQRLTRRLIAGAALVALFALPIAAPMYLASRRQPWLHDVRLPAKSVFAADLASYLMPARWVEQAFTGRPDRLTDIYGVRARGASDVFPGYITWLCFVGAIAWRICRGRRGNPWLAVAAVFFVLSLGPVLKFGGIVVCPFTRSERIVMPAIVLHWARVFEGIRVFLRFAFAFYLCIAIFIGIQAAHLLASMASERARRLATVGLAVAACLLVAERLDLPRPIARVPDVPAFEWLRKQPAGTVLLCPIVGNQRDDATECENLYSQTRHEKPMVNPYVSRRPEDAEALVADNPLLVFLDRPLSSRSRTIATEPAEHLTRAWKQLGVAWIVVDRFAYVRQPGSLDSIDRFLKNTLDLAIAYEDDQYLLYSERWQGRSGEPDATTRSAQD